MPRDTTRTRVRPHAWLTATVTVTSVLALAGCTAGSVASEPTPTPSPVVGPSWFTGRTAFEPCGQFGPPDSTEPPDVPDSAWACVQDPGPDGGELVLVRNSVEGDPIVTYIRVTPGVDGIELISDNRADAFRSEDWTHLRCTSFTFDHEVVGCVDA
jgi:hypothetical protein